ncbi:MAG: histidine phosphatase family protein [Chitinophagales bacterium]|nr:histidine phosphatase family protein [Chitinophagales bacterium]
MASTQEIYLIRHGETEQNRNNIIQGRGIDSVLNETGIRQAWAFYEHYKHLDFDHILTSTLQRTQQTVGPFLQNGYNHTAHWQLDEINWGYHEGKAPTPMLTEEYKMLLDSWRAGQLHLSIPQGESPLDLQNRQLDFIENILPQYEGRILICTHGRAMRIMLCTLLQNNLCLMDDFPHKNLSLYIVKGNGNGRYELAGFNLLDHLKNI